MDADSAPYISTGNAMIVQCGISTYIVWRFLGLGMFSLFLSQRL